MAQPTWQGGRGGGRARVANPSWSSNTIQPGRPSIGARGAVPGRLGGRTHVWTPASATSAEVVERNNTSVADNNGSTGTKFAGDNPNADLKGDGTAAAIEQRSGARSASSALPELKARTSVRRAAEAIEVASQESAVEIEAHLTQVEERLTVVRTQEDEVRAIADEHLERETDLKKLLKKLHDEQQQQQQSVDQGKEQAVGGDAPSLVASNDSPHAMSSMASDGVGDGSRGDADKLAANLDDHGAVQKTAVAATLDPSSSAQDKSRTVESAGVDRVQASSFSNDTGSSTPGAAKARATATTLGAASTGLLLAMAIGGPGDGLLTRDAATVEEYIALMSDEAAAAEEAEAIGGEPPVTQQRHQPGLSIKEALNRAEAVAARPPRMPTLLGLAALIRPVRAAQQTTAFRAPSSTGKRKGVDNVEIPAEAAVAEAVTRADGGKGEREAPVVRVKRRRIDPTAIMCPFELNGVCNDDDCRYQHLDAYLPILPSPTEASAVGSASASDGPAPNALSTSVAGPGRTESGRTDGSRVNAVGLPAASRRQEAVSRYRAEMPDPWRQLPDIDFTGREERRGGTKGNGRGIKRQQASNPGATSLADRSVTGAGAGGDDGGSFNGDNGDGSGGSNDRGRGNSQVSGDGNVVSVDVGDDFLALSAGSAVPSAGRKFVVQDEHDSAVGGSARDDANAALALPDGASPATLAKAFACAASGTAISSSKDAGDVGGRARGGGGRDERYYKEEEEGSYAAVAALTEAQLTELEVKLMEAPSFDEDGWLLLAMHRLPRNGNSAMAVLNTIGDVARGADGPLGNADDAAIKPALRAFVRGLERVEPGQGEALWLCYLRLFALLPGKMEDAMGMVEHALENFPTSRRIWRLYRSMIRQSGQQSLLDETTAYERQIQTLLLLRATATGPPTDSTKSATGVSHTAGSPRNGDNASDDKTDAILGMIVYLVLERCYVLAEAGYTLQAAAEALDAVGDAKPLRGWDDSQGEESGWPLRIPSRQGEDGGGDDGGGSGASGGSGRLPKGIAAALKHAPRRARCLLWLATLHLLVMGVFPRHLLSLAEGNGDHNGSNPDDTGEGSFRENESAGDRRPDLLRWPKEWLSPASRAGVRLSASAELRDATRNTLMSAVQDVGLLPLDNGRGGGWAPPLRKREALLPEADEADTARKGGTAPEMSALEGPSLALALNWMAYFSRAGSGQANGVRTVALACCRRFQLTRPEHPAMLEHILLEHDVTKARSTRDVYAEIETAFRHGGAAAAAEHPERDEIGDGGSGGGENTGPCLSSPSRGRLQAVYAFLRFAEVRLHSSGAEQATSAGVGGDSQDFSVQAAAVGSGVAKNVQDTRDVVRDALLDLWTAMPRSMAHSSDRGSKISDGLLRKDDESIRRAVENAKASLFRWADGAAYKRPAASTDVTDRAGDSANNASDFTSDDTPAAERQLSTIVFALWVLDSPATATGSLDHILSAESFSNMSPDRRRLAWLQRLKAAIVLSRQQVGSGDVMQGVRDVALRALTDSRVYRRPVYPSLAHYFTSTLEQSTNGLNIAAGNCGDGSSHTPSSTAAAVSLFRYEVLSVYADRFRAVRGGIDWVVVAEALGGDDVGCAGGPSQSSSPRQAVPAVAPPLSSAYALLHWVNRADERQTSSGRRRLETTPDAAVMANNASALRSNARPYLKRALARFPSDPVLAGAVAALEAATDGPDRAQRILESALRGHPRCSALWEQRVALEAAFGARSTERARTTASAVASREVLVRLRCAADGDTETESWHGSGSTSAELTSYKSDVQTRTAGRIASAVSNPRHRQETRTLSLEGALRGSSKVLDQGVATTAIALPNQPQLAQDLHSPTPSLVKVPRSVFLLRGLTHLSLAHNGLVSLPSVIGRLLSLRSLDLSGNALTKLPPSLSKLFGSLTTLRAAGNRLTSPLPVVPLGNLVGLRLLDLEQNKLSIFPHEVVLKLTELRTLKLSGNGIPSRAPPNLMDALPHLEEFSMPS